MSRHTVSVGIWEDNVRETHSRGVLLQLFLVWTLNYVNRGRTGTVSCEEERLIEGKSGEGEYLSPVQELCSSSHLKHRRIKRILTLDSTLKYQKQELETRIKMFLIFVLLILQNFSFSRPQCPPCKDASCNCSRLNLREVPAAPSELITELDLSYNRLENVMENDFLAFSSLRFLILNNNRIRTIHREAFAPLIRLEKLDLSENRLDALSAEWFEKLSSLQHLNLLGNRYTSLGPGHLFQPLMRLKSLYVGGALLESVSKNDFSGLFGLEDLFFDGKNLQLYAEGSLSQIGPISSVTLGLNDMFQRNQELLGVLLTDVVHPNASLTFTDTVFSAQHQMFPLKKAFDLNITSVAFKNVNVSVLASVELLNLLSDSKVTMLAFEDMHFFSEPMNNFALAKYPNKLEVVFLKNVNFALFYRFPDLSFLESLLNTVRRVTIINCNLFAIPCETSKKLTNLEFLDISYSSFSDIALWDMTCGGHGVFSSLKTINISRANQQSINSIVFTKLEQLSHLDLSGNRLQNMPETCHWPASLQFLNLSSSHQTKVTGCLPESLQILDLSRNQLTVFNVELPRLRELYVYGNKIGHLPDGSLFPHLRFLHIHSNNLQTFSLNDLNAFKKLERLEARGSSYICSCVFVNFMTKDLMNHQVLVEDDLNSYICDSPDALRHKSIPSVRLSAFQCHAVLLSSLLCSGILVLVLLSAGLCYKLNVIWYLRMTCAWLRAKKKPKLKKGLLEFDAFVSYSEMDSGWVEAHLVAALEQSEPPLRLCLHKRDFLPGGLIQDNIMDAIEKSHKTIFILSQHFVRSEWCKYELEYSHFRLFDQNDDTIVLILLEPIDKDKIPKRFCWLRSFMNSRTYLEWPDENDQIPVFWDNLRAAVKPPDLIGEAITML